MSKSIINITLAILLSIVCYSCVKTKTNRELFSEGLEKNIAEGIKPLIEIGVDSIVARDYITCVLTAMYQIDSTYFLKEPNQQKEIFINNESYLQKCAAYLLQYKDSLRCVVSKHSANIIYTQPE